MKAMTSVEFRKTYPALKEPVAVLAHERYIGMWVPADTSIPTKIVLNDLDPTMYGDQGVHRDRTGTRPMTQPERDAILRRINKGG